MLEHGVAMRRGGQMNREMAAEMMKEVALLILS